MDALSAGIAKRVLSVRNVWTILACVLGVLLLYYSFSQGSDATPTLRAAPAEFIQQVSVSGKVTAADRVDLGFSQSGRVSGVYVEVGEAVTKGDILAEVDNDDLYAAIKQRQAALDVQIAKLKSLEAGTRPEEISIAESQVSSDTVALSQARQSLVEALRDGSIDASNAVHNVVDQFVTNARTNNPQLIFTVSNSQITNDFVQGRILAESTLRSLDSLVRDIDADTDMNLAVEAAQNYLSSISSFLSTSAQALNLAVAGPTVTQTNITTYTANLATARAALQASMSGLTTAATAQKNAVSALELSKRNLVLKKAGTTESDLEAQRAQVQVARADLASAEAQLSKTMIRAPFDGVVTAVDAKVGRSMGPADNAITMLSDDTFQIESYIPEINVAQVRVGHQAVVTLDAYGERVPFQAGVVSIDPAETIKDGVSTYRAVLEFSVPDSRIKAGMTANVVITTGRKMNVISIPQGAVFDRDGRRFVRVRAGETIEERPVVTGDVSYMGEIEIVRGLQPGDIIILESQK